MVSMKILEEIGVIAYKDLKEFTRNRIGLFFSLVMPIMLIAMFGYMFPSSSNAVHDVSVGVVNLDSGPYGVQVSNAIQQALSGSGAFTLVNITSSDEAKSRVLDGSIKGALIIPSNLTTSLSTGQPVKLIILTDPTNIALSGAITQAIKTVVDAVSNQFAANFIAHNVQGFDPQFILKPVGVTIENVIQGGGSYFDYVAPGFIGMGVMMSGLTAVGAALAREREMGPLDGILMAPN